MKLSLITSLGLAAVAMVSILAGCAGQVAPPDPAPLTGPLPAAVELHVTDITATFSGDQAMMSTSCADHGGGSLLSATCTVENGYLQRSRLLGVDGWECDIGIDVSQRAVLTLHLECER